MQQKSEKQNLLTVRKPDAMVASALMGCAVKIINYRWEQSEKFVEICITLSRVHQAPTENVQHFVTKFVSFVLFCFVLFCAASDVSV
uniref:Uncharacterized protein n=1 Tax=Neovison vison TaxID=452646 RepID=A0A8C7CGU9_NEOVI